MTPTITLPAITALARAGAVDRAWELFAEGGFLHRGDDAAALAVKGRLLKDRARREGTATYALAAEAYGAANARSPAPYLAINAATMALLAGDREAAAARAAEVLAGLDSATEPADTPYYLAATRAEALLLRGDEAAAQAAMAEAARLDPDGWDDRVGTLTQLRLIGAALSLPLNWLERFVPPASLHFAGHLGIADNASSERDLVAALAPFLAQHRPGFAWGAIAAGADIVIAEQLLDTGCALHVVLPCPADRFESQSVAPAGDQWSRRYRDLLDAAQSIAAASPGDSSVHDPIATAHAGEIAVGAALLNARRLGSVAMQLIVTDETGGGANTRRQAAMWPVAAGPQITMAIPRDCAVEAHFPPEQPDPGRALSVHIAIGLDRLASMTRWQSDSIAAARAPLAEVLARLGNGAVRADQNGWEAVLDDLHDAAALVAALQDAARAAGQAPPAIGLALAIATRHRDPASGTLVPYGPGSGLAQRLRAIAPPGATLVNDAAAVTLAARGDPAFRTELYHPGEPELGGPVHSLERVAAGAALAPINQ